MKTVTIILLLGLQVQAENWIKAPSGIIPPPPHTVYTSRDFCGRTDCFQIDEGGVLVDPRIAKIENGKIVVDDVKKAAKDAADAAEIAEEASKATKGGQRLTALKACLALASPTANQLRDCLQLVIKEAIRNRLTSAEQ